MYFCYSVKNLHYYADEDFANESVDRKSVKGYCFKLLDNLISLLSKKQYIVTLSSTEFEFVPVCISSFELLYLNNLLVDLAIELFEESQSNFTLLKNFENNRRCKYIVVKLHFIVDLIIQKFVKISYVCSVEQLADVFTKAPGSFQFL